MGGVPDNYRGCTWGCTISENSKLKKLMNEIKFKMSLGYHFVDFLMGNPIKKSDFKNLLN